MADAVLIDFKGEAMTQDLYDQVNARVNPPGNPPAGLIFHSSGPSPTGDGWRVVDVWESRDVFDRFFQSTVGGVLTEIVGAEALAEGPQPEITSWPIHNYTLASEG
jgi:hypothetical protein